MTVFDFRSSPPFHTPGEYSVQPPAIMQPSVPLGMGDEVPSFGGTGGADTPANGSWIGDACGRYLPVLPRSTAFPGCGFALGPPHTPKSAPPAVKHLPESAGPACERSTPEVPGVKAVGLIELTCMLRVGPPQILIKALSPTIVSASGRDGWVTRIGTGATTSTIAAMAVAFTLVKVASPTKRINVVLTSLCTVTLMRWVVSDEKATPGAAVSSGNATVT